MYFKRILSTFTAIGTLSMLVGTGCSSSDKPAATSNAGGSTGTSTGGSTTASTAGGSSATGGSGAKAGANATGGATTNSTAGANATGGATTNSTAGANATGGATTNSTAGANATGGVATGTGGATSTSGATLNDLVGAVCNWEFKCCSAGEAKWELGPTVTSAAQCKTAFTYLLNSDNTATSPYPGTLPALLTILGYSVDPTKVTENATGIAACIAEWNAKTCNTAAVKEAPAHCTAGTFGAIAACDLTNLVKPKQAAGQPCNYALNQASSGNDVECVAGTSCVNIGDPDNPSTASPTCVTRGVAGAVCTSDAKCDYGFYCDTTGTGTCVAKSGPGEACSYKSDTAPVAGQFNKQCKPGLTCNPATKTCTEFCKAGFVCSPDNNDFSCPTGESCIPITVGSTTTFSTCSASGSTIPRCNSAEDCGANYYCNGSTCAPVLVAGDTCVGTAGSGECGTARYCAAGTPRKCTAFTLVNNACTQAAGTIASTECDPINAIGCVYKWNTTTAAASYVCAAALLPNAERCGNNFDCASNKCEFATSSATFKTCIAGAAVGAACLATASATPPTTNMTTCAPGLTCKAGACVAQVGPGENCESTTTAGQADSTMCKNSTCNATQWAASSAIMCTDTLVPVTNGGTGVMCDGV